MDAPLQLLAAAIVGLSTVTLHATVPRLVEIAGTVEGQTLRLEVTSFSERLREGTLQVITGDDALTSEYQLHLPQRVPVPVSLTIPARDGAFPVTARLVRHSGEAVAVRVFYIGATSAGMRLLSDKEFAAHLAAERDKQIYQSTLPRARAAVERILAEGKRPVANSTDDSPAMRAWRDAVAAGSLGAVVSAPAEKFRSISAVTQLLGDPVSAKLRVVPNQHDRVVPNVEATLTWSGMTATFLLAVCCEKTFLQQVVVTEVEQLKHLTPLVPQSREKAIATFGPPYRESADEIVFALENGTGADTVVLRYERERLAAVVWNYFID